MNRIPIIIVLISLLFAAGCSVAVNPDIKYEGTYKSYTKVMDEWTRTKKVYASNFDTIMIVTATYESKEFQKAFVAEKTRAEMLSPSERNDLEARLERQQKRVAKFFLSFYIPEYKWNKLNKDEPSWRLRLEDENGKRVAAANVKRIRMKQVAQTKYYPYYDTWSYYYEVTFPKKTEQDEPLQLDKGKVTLHIAGVAGQTSCEWIIP